MISSLAAFYGVSALFKEYLTVAQRFVHQILRINLPIRLISSLHYNVSNAWVTIIDFCVAFSNTMFIIWVCSYDSCR